MFSHSERDAADGAVDSWLERLAAFDALPAGRLPQQVHYVLTVREVYYVPRVEIHAFVVTPARDGSVNETRAIEIAGLAALNGRYVTPTDRSIARLASVNAAARSAFQAPAPPVLAALLATALETGRLHWASIANPPLRLNALEAARLVWQTGEDGRQRPTLEGRPNAALIPAKPVWYVDPESNQAGPVDLGLLPELAAILAAAPSLTARQADRVQGVWRRVVAPSVATPPVARETAAGMRDDPPRIVLRLDAAEFPYAQLRFAYGERRIAAQDAADDMSGRAGPGIERWRRRRDVEMRAQGRLLDLGLMLVGWPWNQHDERFVGAFRFAIDDDVRWAHVLHVELEHLRTEGWQIEIAPGFPVTLAPADGTWDAQVVDGENRWFELELGITVEGERISLLPVILEALRERELRRSDRSSEQPVYVRLPRNGAFVALPAERLNRILDTLVELFEAEPLTAQGRLRLPPARAAVVEEIERSASVRLNGADSVRRLLHELGRLANADAPTPLPAGFRGELRPYQRHGVAWLQTLRRHGFGAVLADDMGLGKTVQLLAHAALEHAAGRLERAALIVAPTSVVPNWRAEIERFTPHLRVLSLTGADRDERFEQIDRHDIVLTTYPLLQRDAEIFLARAWSLAVLDEAQAIKNPRSKGAQAVWRLQAGQRIALTGTPVENHLDELWSIFAFSVPELLGARAAFTRSFRTPIEKRGDSSRRDALAARVRPFLLRRTKEVVAADLPPKTEMVRRVGLDGPQRDLYETVRLAMHRRVRDEVSRRGIERSRIVVLDALLKLRQICCDPRLVKGTALATGVGSAKLAALFDMLPDLVDDGRRILLFSQFTSMLDLIKPELEARRMPFLELRGSTKDRTTPVARFQRGEVPLFLISLKAGGTGLNLTAADTVIHYDPWWNPAVERQATDRTHRIGQEHPVFIYKLITVGTVEERILEMQARKAELAESLFAESALDGSTFLGMDEIDRLFTPLG